MSSAATPAVVFGLPVYNAAARLPEAIESLLSQTHAAVSVVLVDDCSTDGTTEIAERYRSLDPRVSYERNETRLGLTRNWRRTFERAVAIHPDACYFAWASDHDVWHPRWAEALVAELERRPEAQLAVPDVAILEDESVLRFARPSGESGDATGSAALRRVIASGMRAGHGIYGLFRIDAVRAAGGFRHVLAADRLFLAEVALRGPLLRVPEALWYRRLTAPFSLERQRRSCFPDGSPLYAHLPWFVVHTAVLVWVLAIQGSGRPHIGRVRGLQLAAAYLQITLADTAARKTRRRWKRSRKLRKRLRGGALRRVRAAQRQTRRLRGRGVRSLARRFLT
ncbi:MAG: glycosyltransferase family 2 protein [Actinobacteria bacterium]|nr:glycosyltransferase family 2 protein [Actinomycetota bacterium]